MNFGIHVERLGIAEVNKDNSDLYIDLFDYSEKRMAEIIRRAEFILSCQEAPEPGDRIQDWNCGYCPYLMLCEIAQAKKDTHVDEAVSITEDKDVISAMEILLEARSMGRDAKEL